MGVPIRITTLGMFFAAVAALWAPACLQAGDAPQTTPADAPADEPAATDPIQLLMQAKQATDDAEAIRLVRKALEIDPAHDSAYEQLWGLVSRVKLPENTVRQELLLAAFPGFKLHVTPHFLVVYDTEERFARERGSWLEETHASFYKRFRAAGVRPMPLTERMVCVLFDQHESFVRYARKVDQMAVPWASGYYSSRTNRIAFFHDRDNPQFKAVHDRIDELEQQLEHILAEINTARRAGDRDAVRDLADERRKVVSDRNWHRNRLNVVAKMANRGKTTHECVHQLAFNSGVMARHVAYPFWVAEGLATCYEATEPGRPFGPGMQNNPSRLNVLIEAHRNNQLIPLHDLVIKVRPDSDDEGRVGVYYAQSWGLFNYLFLRHQDDMRRYLQALADMPPGHADPDTLRKHFTDAFGPVENIQTLFTAYLRTVR